MPERTCWHQTLGRHSAADLGRHGSIMIWSDASSDVWSAFVLGAQRTGHATAAEAQAASVRLARELLEDGLQRLTKDSRGHPLLRASHDGSLVLDLFHSLRSDQVMTARAALVSTIAFALTRYKAHFRAMAQTHNTDEARSAAAEIIADQICAPASRCARSRQAWAQHAMTSVGAALARSSWRLSWPHRWPLASAWSAAPASPTAIRSGWAAWPCG